MNLRFLVTCLLITIALISGCQDSSISIISKEQAITSVRAQHEQNNTFGKINVLSVTQKHDEYEVKWDRKSNCESGTDYVNVNDGKITHGVQQIC
ncbi:hypothetical protein J2T13_003351 [Paenibacillus sp. DS2015]|uniref:hypothetical protein n=1 Tax=Paenibacillus sp. DS2015 TaxID=3373917 RepID=UPI003D208AA0